MATIEDRIDRLYRIAPADFISARKKLAAELVREGRKDDADRVRSCGKPLATAWAVNHLYWNSRKTFDRMLEAGNELRRLQQSPDTDVAELRQATERRRKLLAQLTERATKLLADGSHGTGRAVIRRIETTLEALAALGEAGPGQRLGRLTHDMESPGFEAFLQGAVGWPGKARKSDSARGKIPRGRASSDERAAARRRKRDLQRAALERAEKAEAARRDQAARTAAALDSAVQHRRTTEEAEQDALARLERARKKIRQAVTEVRRAEILARRDAAALDRATKAVRKARAALDDL